LWCVRRVFPSLAGLDSVFGNALQNATQFFVERIPQMTKYCVMRECENIHSWISLSGDLVFSHQQGIYGFKVPKRFLEISSPDYQFIDALPLCICKAECLAISSQTFSHRHVAVAVAFAIAIAIAVAIAIAIPIAVAIAIAVAVTVAIAVHSVIAVAMVSHLPAPSSCLPWLVVVSPLVILFLLCGCLLTHSLCLLPPILCSFYPAGCCATSCCADSALRHLSSCHRLSLMHRLAVALPLVAPPPSCVNSHHSTAFCNMPADCHVASHHAPLFYANLHIGNPL
jgi:hypothetical protein